MLIGGRLRSLCWLAGASAGAVALVLVPVVWQGALDELVKLGFTGKGEYLETASLSYPGTLDWAFLTVRMGVPFDDPVGWLTAMPSLFLPVLAACAFALGLAFGGDRRSLLVAGLFGAASFAGAYPRMDRYHLAAAAPCLVVVVAAAWAQLPRGFRRRADVLVMGVAVACAAVIVVGTVDAGRELGVTSLPHVDGARLSPDAERIGQEWRAGLEPGASVFVVRQDAGFAYLVSGAVNPTRYDYPASSNIGDTELTELNGAIAAGLVPRACIGGPPGFLEPEALDALVERTMRPERSIVRCMLFRAR